MARAVKVSILRHSWYLSEQLVVFALFYNGVDAEIRAEMATTLHNIPRPVAFPVGKPGFPLALLRAGTATLPQLVGPNSWLLFHLLGDDGGWLTLPPEQWAGNPQYARLCDHVSHLAVVNDAAERGVKDIQDYANAARDGTHRGDIILVSGSHRLKMRDFLKNEMEEHM